MSVPVVPDGIGVYKITNTKTGKVYVGSAAVSFRTRWKNHWNELRRGVHGNIYLQRTWAKYGRASFVFEIIEYCATEDCVTREQYWMDKLEAFGKGYNMSPTAGSWLGLRHSQATKDKISALKKGTKASLETKLKMSLRRKGVKKSPETCARCKKNHWSKGPNAAEVAARISKGHEGKLADPVAIAKMTLIRLQQGIAQRKANALKRQEKQRRISAAYFAKYGYPTR